METGRKYGKGPSIHIKVKPATETFSQQCAGWEKLWCFDPSEFCGLVRLCFLQGASVGRPALLLHTSCFRSGSLVRLGGNGTSSLSLLNGGSVILWGRGQLGKAPRALRGLPLQPWARHASGAEEGPGSLRGESCVAVPNFGTFHCAVRLVSAAAEPLWAVNVARRHIVLLHEGFFFVKKLRSSTGRGYIWLSVMLFSHPMPP